MTNDLQKWLDEDGFELPLIRSKAHPAGRTYFVPAPDIKTGMHLQAMADLGAKVAAGADVSDADLASLRLDDEQEGTFNRMCLGTAYDEMIEDGVSWQSLRRAVKYAFAKHTIGDEAAEALAAPKAQPNRAERRAAGKGKKKKATTGK